MKQKLICKGIVKVRETYIESIRSVKLLQNGLTVLLQFLSWAEF
jgi:hypothetical protein